MDSQNLRFLLVQMINQIRIAGKSGIVHFHIKMMLFQICGEVQQSQRRVGLHYLLFVLIFFQKICVAENDFHR